MMISENFEVKRASTEMDMWQLLLTSASTSNGNRIFQVPHNDKNISIKMIIIWLVE